MAKMTTVSLIDDLDGGAATETVAFALEGTNYEIDLSAKNAKALRSAVATYVAAARKAGGPGKAKRGGTSNAEEIRAWAKAHGHKVNERGRISSELQEAFAAR